jgi:hypothetical protein
MLLNRSIGRRPRTTGGDLFGLPWLRLSLQVAPISSARDSRAGAAIESLKTNCCVASVATVIVMTTVAQRWSNKPRLICRNRSGFDTEEPP